MWSISGGGLAALVERCMRQGIFDLIGTPVLCGKVIVPAVATSKDSRRRPLKPSIKRYERFIL